MTWPCPVCGALNDTPVCPGCFAERPEADDGQTYITKTELEISDAGTTTN